MLTEPTTVVIDSPTLDKDVKGYALTAFFLLCLRALIVWATIAILIPWFGIAYWMVFVALIGLNSLVGPPRYALMLTLNRQARAARKAALEAVSNDTQDEVLLRSRAAASTL